MPPVFIIRRFTSAGLLLIAFAAGCNLKDTTTSHVWPRVIEPQVSVATSWQPCRAILSPGHLVAEARCGEASAPTTCDERIRTPDAARRAVAFRTACLDDAIGILKSVSRRDARAMNDLAAAYYVRAQRDDRASDLLRALDTAEQAIATTPPVPGAHFNAALILESLRLTNDAIAEWNNAIASDPQQWAAEARAHRDALVRSAALTGERRWAASEERIAAGLRDNDENAIAAAVAPFPYTAQRYFEDRLLPQHNLAELRLFAKAFSRASGDQYPSDVVASIDRAAQSPQMLAALQRGQAMLARGNQLTTTPDAAAGAYADAARLLKAGGSPLELSADIALSGARINQAGQAAQPIVASLNKIADTAQERGYLRIAARAHANAANALFWSDRYIESLAEYDATLAVYEHLDDREGIANTQARRIGILRVLGEYEQAWRAALPAVRAASDIVDWRTHHLLVGEAAVIATKLDCPRSALAYMNAEVRHFQGELIVTAPEQKARVLEAETHVAIARRNRASIELQLEQYGRAQQDIDEVVRLTRNRSDVSQRKALAARLDEVEGENLVRIDPKRAADAFARAAALDGAEYASFRISVRTERAEALRQAGEGQEAEAEIRTAVDQLRDEESKTLGQRIASVEPIWNDYFDRFRQAYDQLIAQLVEEGRVAEAFAYNEQAHAQEPLDLILRNGNVPQDFRDLAAATGAARLPKIEAALPAGTVLIEYRVLADRTLAWVVSHDAVRFLTLRATRADVERWTTALQQAAETRDAAAFSAGLYAPYDRLMAPPLAAIGPTSRLVFVPDEFMFGLPFAALRDPISGHYLIERAPIAISGSGTLYAFSLSRDRTMKRSEPEVLLVGDPAFDVRLARGAPRLSAARNEAQAIRSLYGPRVTELTGRNATSSRFLREAQKSQIIDLAVHAVTPGESPSQPYLLLAPSRDDSGVLDAQTLMKSLRLENTRLVVLGACRSGGGITVGPQGVAPLVRPFLAAGVPGAIGTLWDINDATAEEVLVSFHRHYRQGSDAAEALRTAQLELLRNKNPGLRSELAWAPYQAIGFATSPFALTGDMKKEKPP
jgi:CHAT domain-containing protein